MSSQAPKHHPNKNQTRKQPQEPSLSQYFERYSDRNRNSQNVGTDTSTTGPLLGGEENTTISVTSAKSEPQPASRTANSVRLPSPSSQGQLVMRRRNARDPRMYYHDADSVDNPNAFAPRSSHAGTPGDHHRGGNSQNQYFNIDITSPTKSSGKSSFSTTAPMTFTPPAPKISDFMPADEQYVNFLLTGNHRKSQSPASGIQGSGSGPSSVNKNVYYHAQNTSASQPFSVQFSKFLTIFSAIATFLLILFGFLIEVQPLYIKGISASRTPMTRNLHGEYSAYSFVHFSARLRILQNITLSQQETDREEMARMLESMTFEMKKEAKVAFKAAALYFLVMIFSIIYSQNHILIQAKYQQYNVLRRIKTGISLGMRNVALLIRKYRRRNYSNVQEVNRMGMGMSPGIGLAKVNVNARNKGRRSPTKAGMGDFDADLEGLGLSLRERQHPANSPTREETHGTLASWVIDKSNKR